jgi:hypothetical protein
MAIETLILDGFDGYSTTTDATYDNRWAIITGWTWNGTFGRESGGCLRHSITTSEYVAFHNLPQAVRTIVVGFALKFGRMPDTEGEFPLELLSGAYGNTNFVNQLGLSIGADGKFRLYRGDFGTGTLLATGTTVLVTDSWYYIEFRAYIDDTAGEYELKIDGSSEFSGTAVDTQNNAGDNTIGAVGLFTPDHNTNLTQVYTIIDDFYLRGDPTANTAGGFLGDVRIVCKVPDANGTNRDWTLSTGTDDFAVLDEIPPASADYAYSSTATDQITCGMEDLTGSITIKEVALYTHTSIGASGSREVKPVCKSGATTDVGSARRVLQHAYIPPEMYPVDPNTATAWTLTNLNAAEFGLEVV